VRNSYSLGRNVPLQLLSPTALGTRHVYNSHGCSCPRGFATRATLIVPEKICLEENDRL
jgi:hypothetical protein